MSSSTFVNPALRACAYLGFPLLVLCGMLGAWGSPDPVTVTVCCAFVLAAGAFLWRFGAVPLLVVHADGLEVRNPLETRWVPWSELAGVRVVAGPVWLHLRDGRRVMAWSTVEFYSPPGRRTYAERVADQLAGRAALI